MIDDRFDLQERVSINITIILLGLTIFHSLAGELGLDVSIPFEAVINSQVEQLVGEEAKGTLDRLMEHTATMVASSENFQYGMDYQLDIHSGELILRTVRWLAELWKFCREYTYYGEIITNKQMRNFLTENKERNGFVKESHGVKRTLSKVQRCTIINVFQLEKDLGIPVDTWIK